LSPHCERFHSDETGITLAALCAPMMTTAPDMAPQILIVDDVPGNLLALEALLTGLDCVPVRASSGAEAIDLLMRETFAVALLDVRMPDIDGYEVARHARRHSATRELPLIFLTAEAPTDELERIGYGTGCVDFLFKPLNREVLRSKVRVFLDLHLSQRALAETNQRLSEANARLLALVEAEAAATRALRQANQDLDLAYRKKQQHPPVAEES
jgi:CheY-like chemotaxis protein